MIEVPQEFKPNINTIYPFENEIIFEEWVVMQSLSETNREYLPVMWTSYQVNHNYGNDVEALSRLQNFINELPKDKKYFTIIQYDDSILVDVSGIDLLQFNMSKNIGIPIPLLSMPHSYVPTKNKNYIASFIGTHTHPIREKIFNITSKGYYISDAAHNTAEFCKIISESNFGLCPRGYGLNSFRIGECMQYGTIPVYISDEFVIPFDLNFSEYGILIPECDADNIEKILKSYSPLQIIDMQDKCKQVYQEYYTYAGALNKIMKYLES